MSTLLAPILQYFFTEHLTTHKQVSPRTIIAYRDSFRLFLRFLKNKTGKQPSALCVASTMVQLAGDPVRVIGSLLSPEG